MKGGGELSAADVEKVAYVLARWEMLSPQERWRVFRLGEGLGDDDDGDAGEDKGEEDEGTRGQKAVGGTMDRRRGQKKEDEKEAKEKAAEGKEKEKEGEEKKGEEKEGAAAAGKSRARPGEHGARLRKAERHRRESLHDDGDADETVVRRSKRLKKT